MFTFLNMTPNEYWRILLFKDNFNFGGVRESNPGKVTNRWDMALHLPEAIQKKFIFIVSEFVLKIYKHNIKIRIDGED